MTTGIYLLYFEELDQVYVGQSINISKRYRDHKSALSLGKHTNCKLQKAYALYGIPKLQILEQCESNNLDKLEIFWTHEFNSLNNGLNVCYPGNGAGSGIHNHNSKYSKLQLLRVFRKLYLTSSSFSNKEIGIMYGVNESTVASIRLGDGHLWLKEEFPWQYSKIKATDINKTHSPVNLIQGGVYLKDPLGIVHNILNIREFARKNSLDPAGIFKVRKGKCKHTKGWTLP